MQVVFDIPRNDYGPPVFQLPRHMLEFRHASSRARIFRLVLIVNVAPWYNKHLRCKHLRCINDICWNTFSLPDLPWHCERYVGTYNNFKSELNDLIELNIRLRNVSASLMPYNIDMYLRRVGWSHILRAKLKLFMCLLIWRKDAMRRLGAPGGLWYREDMAAFQAEFGTA